MTQATTDLLTRLRTDRSLSAKERSDLLLDDADPDLLRDILAARLNRTETNIVMVLALDWPAGEPTAADLASVLKERVVARSVPNPRDNPKQTDITTQLGYLVEKDWVCSRTREDGQLVWELLYGRRQSGRGVPPGVRPADSARADTCGRPRSGCPAAGVDRGGGGGVVRGCAGR